MHKSTLSKNKPFEKEDWRDGSTHAALILHTTEKWSLGLSANIRQLTAACDSRSRISDALFWCPWHDNSTVLTVRTASLRSCIMKSHCFSPKCLLFMLSDSKSINLEYFPSKTTTVSCCLNLIPRLKDWVQIHFKLWSTKCYEQVSGKGR